MIHLENALKMSLQDVLKMFWRHLEDIFKTSWKGLEEVFKTFWRRLEEVLKTSWRRLEDVWPKRIYWSWPRRLEDVFNTSSEDVRLRRTYSSWSKLLEDVFWRRRRKTSSRRLQNVLIKMNVCWDTSKLGWSSKCLRYSQFEHEIMLAGMLNFKTHFFDWYCVWYEHCNGLFNMFEFDN